MTDWLYLAIFFIGMVAVCVSLRRAGYQDGFQDGCKFGLFKAFEHIDRILKESEQK